MAILEQKEDVQAWFMTINDFNGLCAYCSITKWQECDHFIPKTRGGKDVVANYLPACIKCNKSKSNLTGEALIGLFSKTTIDYLKSYLEKRFNQTIVFPITPSSLKSYKKGPQLIIKEIAERQGLKQTDLSMKSGVTAQLINRYWNNNIKRVDLNELERIAKALGVKTSDLIVDNDEDKQAQPC